MADPEIIISERDRVVRYTGKLQNKEVSQLIESMQGLIAQEPRDPIYFYLFTYGGGYDSVSALYDYMTTRETPITTIASGTCMSGGVLLIASGTGERFAYPNTRFMMHGLQASTGYNSHIDNKIIMDENERINKNFIDLLAKETGVSKEKIKDDIKRDKYLTAEQAKEYGIIDEIIK